MKLLLLAIPIIALTIWTASGAITQQAYLKASNTSQYSRFGNSVAVSGDTAVVAAYGESNAAEGSGAVYVFVRNGTSWKQQAYLKASFPDVSDTFGRSVAISGDTVVVGASGECSSASGVDGDQTDNSTDHSGAAYIFVRNGTNWTQQAYLKASNPDVYDLFGMSVGISGDTVVVGAPYEDSSAVGSNGDPSDNSTTDSGAACVFVRSGTNWTQQAYLKASNTGTNDEFGMSVGISGDTVVVGAPYENSVATDSGAAYVFVRSGTNWTHQAYLKASNAGMSDQFGSVAISGDTVVIGAANESSSATGINGNQADNNAVGSGAAYVFVRNGTNWTQQAYLKASNTGGGPPGEDWNGDWFGNSVAVSGDTVVVGAYQEDSSARGVNGNQSNNSLHDAGAAYVFVRNETTWTQQAYLKASNTGFEDYFGFSVAVSGGTVVVGAREEYSSAIGVNGNQNNDSAPAAGAAYVFTGVGLGPQLTITGDGSSGYSLRFQGAPEITYRLQRTLSLTGPWSTIATNTAPPSGLIEYHETTPPPGAAFYRTVQP